MYRLRSSVVCLHNDKVLGFRAIDPHDGREFVFLPGGAIEDGETAPETAIRETLEETGYEVLIDPTQNIDRDYSFYWNGENYECTTIFYWAKLKSPFPKTMDIQDASYHKGVVWIEKQNIQNTFNYTPEILETIQELIKLYSGQ